MRVNKAHETISLSVKFSCCFSLFVYFFFPSLGCIVPPLTSISVCNLMSIYHLISSTIRTAQVCSLVSLLGVFFFVALLLHFLVASDSIALSLRTSWRLECSPKKFVQTSESALVLFVRCVDQSSGINYEKITVEVGKKREIGKSIVCFWHKYQWPIKS